jgi:hypothetical protein
VVRRGENSRKKRGRYRVARGILTSKLDILFLLSGLELQQFPRPVKRKSDIVIPYRRYGHRRLRDRNT